MPAGRPTKYDPAFCDVVIELGKQGKSKAYMAAHLNVSRASFDLWEHQHPEFSEAVNQAVAHSQYWWEEQMQLAATGANPDANATLFIFNMKNRFHQDWKDKRETELSGSVELFDKRQIDAVAAAILNETTESD